MDSIKKQFDKLPDSTDKFKCKIRIKQTKDKGQEIEVPCDTVIVVSEDSLWNLKRHLIRSHEDIHYEAD